MQKQVIDVQAYTKEGKTPPKDQNYKIMVDRDHIILTKAGVTGREILTAAGKVPVERFQLNKRVKGGQVSKVGHDQIVNLDEPGLEKFMTIPLDQTEGGR